MVINLKNKIWILIALIIIVSICIGIYFFTTNNNKYNNNTTNNNQSNYNASKSSTNTQNHIENNAELNSNNINETNTIEITQNSTGNTNYEEQVASFSTKIYTKESGRQNNVSITCQKLNGTIISNGSTFSFCDTIGPATSEKGYQKAEIFDNNGNKKMGLGGGNCQVSTTLYNAALQVPALSIVERHNHSNKVPYIQTGNDAAVAYGSYDLRIRNDTGYDIKISAENTADNITISLYK